MGYEIKYSYHPEVSKGEYDRETTHSGSVKVGSPYDDVPLEVLAGKVMALLARRAILVTGVEIFEMVKKPLTFKEMEDGIVIKNKKFRFDDGPALTGGEEIKEIVAVPKPALPTPTLPTPSVAMIPAQPHEQKPRAQRPIRFEVFQPDLAEVQSILPAWAAKLPTLKFTKGKKYPIFEEKAASGSNPFLGVVYTTEDDTGKRLTVPDKLFVMPTALAVPDEVAAPLPVQGGGAGAGLTDSGLRWDGVIGADDIPDLRKKR
jgi:hypothetical protein